MKSFCQMVLLSMLLSSVAMARSSPAAEPPPEEAPAAPAPAPAMNAPPSTPAARSPSAAEWNSRRSIFVVVGSVLGASGGGYGGARLASDWARGRGVVPGSESDLFAILLGGGLGAPLGAGLGTILAGWLLPGDGNKSAGVIYALIGTGASLLVTLPLVAVIGVFAFLVPIITTVLCYSIGYDSQPATAPVEPPRASPPVSVLPFVNLLPDGTGRVGLVGTF